MSKLQWDKTGERYYETGVKNLILFPYDTTNKEYGKGIAWNGVTGITESPSGAEPTALWADNIKYLNLYSTEEYGSTITAYDCPPEFETLDGTAVLAKGVRAGQQARGMFGYAYRTEVGNDTEGTDFGYKWHLVYGAQASPSEKSHSTINESPEATELSWTINTTPVEVTGFKPTSTITVNSADFTTTAEKAKLAAFEDYLMGTDATGTSEGSDARLPLPAKVVELLGTANAQG